jgi:hypothetical protein
MYAGWCSVEEDPALPKGCDNGNWRVMIPTAFLLFNNVG